VERDTLLSAAILAAIVLGLVAAVFWPQRESEETTPVTCTDDQQCGGTIETERYCTREGLFARGQRNTCVQPGTAGNRCETSYEPWKLADEC
jgi:uncharacterized protein HemX